MAVNSQYSKKLFTVSSKETQISTIITVGDASRDAIEIETRVEDQDEIFQQGLCIYEYSV